MLFVVATPIGNLKDLTLRALEILKEVDLILCEDTRKSRILLNFYQIDRPLKSLHKFNESQSEKAILSLLEEGKKLALISDAGMPTISDPGTKLIHACRIKGIPVTVIPGPSAPITALCLSGWEAPSFQFIGFLPKKAQEKKQKLQDIFSYPGVTLCFESPHRLLSTLKIIDHLFPESCIGIAKEMTKTFEKFLSDRPKNLLAFFEESPSSLKGEFVLLFQGKSELKENYHDLPIADHVQLLETSFHLTKQEAIKFAAKERGVPKRQIYNDLLKNKP